MKSNLDKPQRLTAQPKSHSPYLDQPLLPLVIALPQMLERLEGEIAAAGPEEKRRLETRACLIRELLASQPVA